MSDDAQQCADIGDWHVSELDELLAALRENTAALKRLTERLDALEDDDEDDIGGFTTLGET